MNRHTAITLLALLVAGGAVSAQTVPAMDPTYHPPAADCGCDNHAPGHDYGFGGAPCGPDGQIWAEADYLVYWMKGAYIPALITTSPANTPLNQAGVVGRSTTTILVGEEMLNDDMRNGVRLRAGFWFDAAHTLGMEAEGFFLERQATSFVLGSDDVILARPFLNAQTRREQADVINVPGSIAGSAQISYPVNGITGAGIWARENWSCEEGRRFDVLLGYRYLRFRDRLSIGSVERDLTINGPTRPAGTTLEVTDRFDCENEFHGLDIGIAGEIRRDDWYFGGRVKCAIGETRQVINITGATYQTTPGGIRTEIPGGGLYALNSDIGRLSNEQFSVVPEINLHVGYQLTKSIRASVGYTYLFWSDVVWAGRQINPKVNTDLLPPNTGVSEPAQPARTLHQNSVWAQGLDFSLEYRY